MNNTLFDKCIIYTFYHLKRPFYRAKNKKKCKINSRNFTYDGLTFSSSFFPSGFEDVKRKIQKHN